MRPYSIGIIIFILVTTMAAAQKESHNWLFGYYSGISFNTGDNSPEWIGGNKIYNGEGTASISDPDGNLLFYTNGIHVYNSAHQLMENGSGLKGHNSSTQSALILEWPGRDGLYYIFTVPNINDDEPFVYSIVDINANSGKGKIIKKNVPLRVNINEKLTAVLHSNQRDYWIIVHERNSDLFFSYQLTPEGIDKSPVVSKAGSRHLTGRGYLKSNFDGTRLAAALYNDLAVELFDFDKLTGEIRFDKSFFGEELKYAYGLEFSLNGKYLYISTARQEYSHLFLLDIENTTQDNLKDKLVLISADGYNYGALQYGPDGSIYHAREDTKYLGIIKNPEEPGDSVEYVPQGFFLESGSSSLGLPNFTVRQAAPEMEKACTPREINLVENGGFESGEMDFSSDFNAAGNENDSGIKIEEESSAEFSEFSGKGQTGNFLRIINSGSNQKVVWSKNILVRKFTDYNVTFWALSLDGKISNLTINAGGMPSPVFTVQNDDIWSEISFEFNSGNKSEIELQIVCENPDDISTRFGIDDISLRSCDCYFPDNPAGDDITICKSSAGLIGNYSNIDFNCEWFPKHGLTDPHSAETEANPDSTTTYRLLLVNESGMCRLYDTVTVHVRDMEEFSVVHPEEICSGGIAEVKLEGNYDEIYWSNGALGKTAYYSEAGNHFVTVHDGLGCDASRNFSFRQISREFIETNLVDFGETCLGSPVRKEITYINNGNDDFVIEDIYLLNGKNFEIIGEQWQNPVRPVDYIKIEIEFNPEISGNPADTLVISTDSPCDNLFMIPLTGSGLDNSLEIDLPDLTKYRGEVFTIPVLAKLTCREEIMQDLSGEFSIEFNKSLLYVDSVSGGELLENHIKGNHRILKIRFSNKTATREPSEFALLHVFSMLGDDYSGELIIENTALDNSNLSVNGNNGNLILQGCAVELGNIRLFEPVQLSVNYPGDDISINVTGEYKGKFHLKLYNLSGEEIETIEFSSEGKYFSRDFPLNKKDFSTGLYFIRLISPDVIISEKLIIR
jgi:hypothetical protein